MSTTDQSSITLEEIAARLQELQQEIDLLKKGLSAHNENVAAERMAAVKATREVAKQVGERAQKHRFSLSDLVIEQRKET